MVDLESGQPLPGANVQIVGTSLGASTDGEGAYFILNVPPGEHTLSVTFIGFVEQRIVVRVNADLTTTQNFNLGTEAIEVEGVTVTGIRRAIEIDRTNTAAFVSAEQIENLPVQDISDLIQLQAGVVLDQSGGIHIRGGRTGEIAYLVDGVPISDQFSTDGGSLFNVETGNIQELQVISGTFNAEYGQAQSGVINVITKDPGRSYSWQLTGYGGDRISGRTGLYPGIDQLRPANTRNVEGSFSGPLLPKTGFYLFGRFISDDGYYFGRQLAQPEDAWRIGAYETWYSRKFSSDPAVQSGVIPIPDSLFTGDGSVRAMTPRDRLSLNVKVSFRPFSVLHGSYSLFLEDSRGRVYDDDYRFTPDALKHIFKNNQTHILNFSHTLSPRSFYVANFSYTRTQSDEYLFEEIASDQLQTLSPSRGRFNLGGTPRGREEVDAEKLLAKLDWSWQIDKYSLIKFGGDVTAHRISFRQRTPEISDDPALSSNVFPTDTSLSFAEFLSQSKPATWVPPQLPDDDTGETGLSDIGYEHSPVEFDLYIQNTIELNELIINLGLRYDWFKPDHSLLADPRVNPLTGSVTLTSATDLIEAEPKAQLSPRLGLAFPISDRGVLHIAYGHFFKLPPFAYIYDNSEYKIGGLNETTMGNPDLLPQRTISYELGLQQELQPGLGLELTMFYSDFRNLLGLEIVRLVGNVNTYYRRVNRDFGFNKGITVSMKKTTGAVTGTLDYTYQVVMGNESDPSNIAIIATAGSGGGVVRDAETQMLPLDWDQRHTANGTLAITTKSAWVFSFIGRLSSGQPYTPEALRLDVKSKFKNSEFKPWKSNLDFYANKAFTLGGLKASFFLKVFNLLDEGNQLTVFPITGTAGRDHRFTIQEELERRRLVGLFTLQDIDNHQDWYSQPRRVQLGLSLRFN
ncbi:MAG: TonB-dependent receptor [Candidatus Marinimicrobia bacterium]|nr:TonB-dependent receptor [Candidatus Neomarinimicrobiota bacterium]